MTHIYSKNSLGLANTTIKNQFNSVQYTIHYGEIGLKGKLVRRFENVLKRNIAYGLINAGLSKDDFKLKFDQKIGTLTSTVKYKDSLERVLAHTFGISWFGRMYTLDFAQFTNLKPEQFILKVAQFIAEIIEPDDFTFESWIDVKRYDKNFKYTSMQIGKMLAELLGSAGFYFSKDSPKFRHMFVYWHKDHVDLVLKKFKGLGGLPVGVSGRAILLFSGGIDSPVAAYLLAKRGLRVDLLHFHPGKNFRKRSKIFRLADVLKTYIPFLNLYTDSCEPFMRAVLKVEESFKLRHKNVIFRRFMLKQAYKLFNKKMGGKPFAIATGDNLGQVSSQTLTNLISFDNALREFNNVTILRPLLTFDKQEIINLAKEIGTYDLSIQDYTDCCALIAHNSKTMSSLNRVLAEEKKVSEQLKGKLV